MGPVGEDGDDERLGVGADRSPPAAEAVGGPLGVAPVSAGHVLGIGAMPTTAVAALMRGHARATMEDFERSLGEARVDLRPDQGVRHRVVKAVDLDMIVESHPSQTPLRVLPVRLRQGPQHRPFDALEQVPAAQSQTPHHARVQPFENLADRLVAVGEREEGLMAQAA